MSSLLNSLDMSLDDLISKNKQARGGGRGRGRGRGEGGAGPQRKNRSRQRGRNAAAPYSKREETMEVEDGPQARAPASRRDKKVSILSRLGGKKPNANGTELTVENLKYDVLEEEVNELFSTVGKVKSASIVYDRTGRSSGVAKVIFTRHADAEKAVTQYNGRTLDGRPMRIAITSAGAGGKKAARDDNANSSKDSIFGSALNGNADDGARGRGRGRGRGRRGRGGRGGGRSSTRRNVSQEDLDQEMDSYMNDA